MTRLVVIISVTFILLGCADDQGIVQLSKEKTQQTFLIAKSAITHSLETEKVIEGEHGGAINFNLKDSDFGIIGNLDFPEYSFVDQKHVKINIPETELGAAILDIISSDVRLEKPIRLSLKFTGLKIEEGDIIDFNYIDEKGDLNDVEYGRLIIDYEDGWALVVDAKIYQFARYGFIRKMKRL